MTVAAPRPAAVAPPIPRPRRRTRPATLSPGDRVGAWRVECELGRGGMGSVYAVTHNGFGKRAAMKLCHQSVLGPDFTFETFLREARIVHLVDHPGVPDVFATGTYDGRPYLAMERLAGETLGQRLDRAPMAPAESLDTLLELCDILTTAHAAGVVHRDLKLDNIFVLASLGAGNRRIKLLDWGVARILGEDDPMRGMIAGTLTYVAPEQVRGEDLTPAADLYSLGVLAYLLLLGEPPFTAASDLELIRKHLHATPPAPGLTWPEIPPGLAVLLVQLLAKNPEHRPTLAETARGLEAARDRLRPKRRSFWSRLRALPSMPPTDVLGRPAPLFASARRRLVGATLGLAAAGASVAALIGA